MSCDFEYAQRPEVGVGSLRAVFTGSCELPDLDAGNRIQVPWKSRKHC